MDRVAPRLFVSSAQAIALAVSTAALIASAAAAEPNKLKQIITVKGSCTSFGLIVDDRVRELAPLKDCANILVSTRYADGRQGFYLAAGKITLTFSGKRVIDTKDGFIQDVDGVIYAVDGKKTEGMVDAVGICKVRGNSIDSRLTIECTAQVSGRPKFYIDFFTDGAKPLVKDLD